MIWIELLVFLALLFFLYRTTILEDFYYRIFSLLTHYRAHSIDIEEVDVSRYTLQPPPTPNDVLYVHLISEISRSSARENRDAYDRFYNSIIRQYLFYITLEEKRRNFFDVKVFSILTFISFIFLVYLISSFYIFSELYLTEYFQNKYEILLGFFLFTSAVVLYNISVVTNNIFFRSRRYWANYTYNFLPNGMKSEIGADHLEILDIYRRNFHFELTYRNNFYNERFFLSIYNERDLFQIRQYIRDVAIAVLSVILLESYLSIKNITIDSKVPINIKSIKSVKEQNVSK